MGFTFVNRHPSGFTLSLLSPLVVAAVVLGPPVVAGAAAQTTAPSHKHVRR